MFPSVLYWYLKVYKTTVMPDVTLIYVRDGWHQDVSEIELCGLFYLLDSLIVNGSLDIPQTLNSWKV